MGDTKIAIDKTKRVKLKGLTSVYIAKPMQNRDAWRIFTRDGAFIDVFTADEIEFLND